VLECFRSLVSSPRWALQGLGAHAFREDLADRDHDVLQLGERRPPGQTVGAVEAIDQALGHAFEVRLNLLDDGA
jgi:hypothetical protein